MDDDYIRPSQPKVAPIGSAGHRQRMFDRFLNSIQNIMEPRDLLEILLFFAIPVKDTRDTAVRLMKQFHYDIMAILNASMEALTSVFGVGHKTALVLRLVGSIISELSSPSKEDDRPKYKSIHEIGELMKPQAAAATGRELWGIALNGEGQIIRIAKLNYNPSMSSFPDMSDIARLTRYSQKFVLAHLSPPEQSIPDHHTIMMAQRIAVNLAAINQRLWDFIMVDGESMMSFRECAILL